jgi:hypothetical protein
VPNNEHGDFQTPLALALECLRRIGLPPDARVLEPTCGRGSFLEAAASLSPGSERVGLELQPHHAAEAARWGEVQVRDIFTTDLATDVAWRTGGPLYVIGNPPWVTSAELARMGSGNLPAKRNLKNARGIDALLGSSNFDVAEYVVLKLLESFRDEPLTLGMLCKTQVARNVVEHAAAVGLPVVGATLHRIDAKRWFSAAVDACWLTVRLDRTLPVSHTCTVHDALDGDPATRFGMVDGRLVADVDRHESVRAADGVSPYEWRSGLKHDAAAVFELRATPGPAARTGEALDLEAEFVHPFLKSTDVFRGRERELVRWVVVPQRTFGAETDSLARTAPRLWRYLTDHADLLDARRSSIYRNRPRFSVFGHGDYTWAPYKVAVSGLHKEPVFRLVGPVEGRPVVLDDTCYFLPFQDATEAAVVAAALASEPCLDLVESLVFWDAKRPITKRLLGRIDLNRLPLDVASVVAAAGEYAGRAGVELDEQRARGIVGRFGRDEWE